MDERDYKSEWRIKKEARNLAIYEEYKALMAQPDAMRYTVYRNLAKKYGFGSETTVYFIIGKMEKSLKEEEQQSIKS
jgi:hypothetical protein